MKKILTIAGYDPSTGAGITKDLDVFSALGIHGVSVPTCIVLQGPRGVQDVYPIPYSQFFEMMDMVKKSSPVDGIKIGVVWNEAYVERIAYILSGLDNPVLVVDPVMASKNGTRLLSDEGLQCLIEQIFPVADVVTPNLPEASFIIGKEVETLEDMEACAKDIFDMGPGAVVVKGGHLTGEPIDLFFDGKEFTSWKKHRINQEVHGTGCAFSSLITAFLVHGYDKKEAFLASEKVMEELLEDSYRIDIDGYFYTSSGITNSRCSDRWGVLQAMKEAGEMLCRLNMADLIPAVQMNMGYAIRDARGIEDIAAFPGRIGINNGKILIKGEPAFGASSHVARLILTFLKYYPHIRSCVSVRYDRAIIEKAHESAMNVLFFDRKSEPEKLKEAEGKSLDYLTEEVLKRADQPPDIIYDLGDVGKEPIIRLFAKDPLELINKMEMIRP
ncbi:MAG: bifunctional hydroxymethylpyrimidine kinase/phosphomethylpyrimidine kinase [Proteobacteria bacterium]|nr:bifunctional hydroxymethylpyrimidine kinase/phosphomethylpyrimidine kinase [Pseudomonadota bacterium]